MYKQRLALALALSLVSTGTLNAQDLSGQVAELRQMLTEMKSDYESRIEVLERRLDRAERSVRGAKRNADEAMEISEQTAISVTTGA